MRTKLTVTIDKELIPRAKETARKRGVSLSKLIEGSLREAVAEETTTFSQRWRGKFELADRDDERYRALLKRHS